MTPAEAIAQLRASHVIHAEVMSSVDEALESLREESVMASHRIITAHGEQFCVVGYGERDFRAYRNEGDSLYEPLWKPTGQRAASSKALVAAVKRGVAR